jgi:ankyrin repeat protein
MPLTEEQVGIYNQIVAIIKDEDNDNADEIQAILTGRTDALTLIDRRKDDTEKGDTLLMLAIRNKKDNIVDYLIDKGADTTPVNSDSETALLLAIRLSFRIDTINKLFGKETDINRRGFKGVPLLVYAIQYSSDNNSYFDLIKEILEKGARVDGRGIILRFSIVAGETIETRETALMCAINNRDFTKEQLTYLISKLTNTSTIDVQSHPKGYTALMFAILRNDLDIPSRITIIQELLKFNPNVNLKNIFGTSAVGMLAKDTQTSDKAIEDNTSLSVQEKQSLFTQIFTLYRDLYRRADITTRNNTEQYISASNYRKSKVGNTINNTNKHIELRIGQKIAKDVDGFDRYLIIPTKYSGNIVRDVTSRVNGAKTIVSGYDLIKTFIAPISDICTSIGEGYRLQSLSKSNLIIAYYTSEEGKSDNEKLIGFVTAKYSPNQFIDIDLICTNYRYKGVGKQLIQIVKDIAKESAIPKITLKSVLPSVPFYSYQGFNVNTEKLDIDLLPMKYNMSKYGGGKRKTKRRTTRPKKRPSKTRRRK